MALAVIETLSLRVALEGLELGPAHHADQAAQKPRRATGGGTACGNELR
jgi:hypothetical protein